MWELTHKEDWAPKSWCFQTVVLEKTLESPLDCREIKPVNSRVNQFWTFIESTRAAAEAPIPWPLDVKCWFIRKHPYAGKDWRQEEKGWQRIRWLDGVTNSTDMKLSKLWEMVKDRDSRHAAVHGIAKSWKQLRDWTTATTIDVTCIYA